VMVRQPATLKNIASICWHQILFVCESQCTP